MTTRMINGVRYYHPSNDAGAPFNSMVLAMINGTWHQQNYYSDTERERDPAPKLDVNKVKTKDVDNNINALEYYKKAASLKGEIESTWPDLGDLTPRDACDENGNPLCNDATFGEYFNNDNKIFDFNSSPIEDPDSNFNEHRLNVIKYSVEKNLAVAISNFNTYSTSSTQFEMPRLSEEEWSSIYDNICVISFLQGLSIGGRLYSGHSVIPNTDNKEVVKEDSLRVVSTGKIYNVTYSNIDYYSIKPENIVNKMALKRSSTEDLDDGHTEYFFRYPNKNVWYAYDSIVTSAGNNSIENGNMYDFIDSCHDDNFSKAYYTALAREREGMYRVENEGFETAYDFPNEDYDRNYYGDY